MWELCGAWLSRENVQIVRLTGGENVLGAEQALSARMWTVFEIALQARVVSWSQCEQFQLYSRSHCTSNCAVCTNRTILVVEELCTSWPHVCTNPVQHKLKGEMRRHQTPEYHPTAAASGIISGECANWLLDRGTQGGGGELGCKRYYHFDHDHGNGLPKLMITVFVRNDDV